MINSYLDKNKIIHIYFIGTTTLSDIVNYLNNPESFKNLPQDLKILYDLRKADLKISVDDIPIINEEADKINKSFKSVKSAYLVINPNATAISILFADFEKSKYAKRKVFSTEKAAKEWLME